MSCDELIQWPKAKWWEKDWNPIIGCQKVSPACENCWAFEWAKRFNQSFDPHKSSKKKPPKSGVVFVGGLTDMFGEFNDSPMDAIGKTAKSANRDATYIYLTKRVDRMCSVLGSIAIGEPYTNPEVFRNHYFGFTAENQEWYDRRIKNAYVFPRWANGWVSCEPLLGSINLHLQKDQNVKARTKWVVAGCESGSNRRPCKVEWVESIVDQCRSADVPVFVKQLDIGGKCVTDITKFPAHLRIRQVPWLND